jgi:hypothetical protein
MKENIIFRCLFHFKRHPSPEQLRHCVPVKPLKSKGYYTAYNNSFNILQIDILPNYQQNPPSESNSFSASQDIPRILWYPESLLKGKGKAIPLQAWTGP